MKSLRSFVLGVLLTATTAFGGVALASSSGPPVPGPGGDAPAAVPSVLTDAATQQMLYSPIAPCRIVDTRKATPLASASTRGFFVAGTSGFAPQGGKSGGCGIPLGATSVSTSITAVDPGHPGFLQAAPSSAPTATVTFLNYGTTSASTGATLALGPGSAPQLRIRNAGGPTDLVIDVTGYFRPRIYGTFTDSGVLFSGNGTLVPVTHTSPGYYVVRADRDLTGCAVAATPYYYTFNVAGYTSGDSVYLQVTQYNGTLADYYFHVEVIC